MLTVIEKTESVNTAFFSAAKPSAWRELQRDGKCVATIPADWSESDLYIALNAVNACMIDGRIDKMVSACGRDEDTIAIAFNLLAFAKFDKKKIYAGE